MRDVKKIDKLCDALKTALDIMWSMDEETLEAVNYRTDIDGDELADELAEWLRHANWSRLQSDKTKQLCRFLTSYWDKYPNEARAMYPDIEQIRRYLSKASGLSVSYDEAQSAVDLWDYTEGEV